MHFPAKTGASCNTTIWPGNKADEGREWKIISKKKPWVRLRKQSIPGAIIPRRKVLWERYSTTFKKNYGEILWRETQSEKNSIFFFFFVCINCTQHFPWFLGQFFLRCFLCINFFYLCFGAQWRFVFGTHFFLKKNSPQKISPLAVTNPYGRSITANTRQPIFF